MKCHKLRVMNVTSRLITIKNSTTVLDFLSWVHERKHNLYVELKNHKNFVRFLKPPIPFSASCFKDNYNEMPYLLCIQRMAATLDNVAYICASIEIEDEEENP